MQMELGKRCRIKHFVGCKKYCSWMHVTRSYFTVEYLAFRYIWRLVSLGMLKYQKRRITLLRLLCPSCEDLCVDNFDF